MIDIPGYVIGTRIGAGSHGVVYQAMSIGVGRPVAIKVIAEPGDLARRFHREVDVLARLSWHPHIVQVFDTGTLEDGTLWAAMELLGSALSRSGAVSAERVADIGVQVASALVVAHDGGIIHRDVKPGNILSGPGGLVKLSDFGIAADLVGTASTLSGFLGTLLYLAPEVFEGGHADERSDQYSFSATLCALAIGGSPFPTVSGGQGIGALIRAKSRPSNERLAASGLPDSMVQVIARGMQPDPVDRFGSVEDLVKDLLTVQREQGWASTRYIGPGHKVGRETETDKGSGIPTIPAAAPHQPLLIVSAAPTTSEVQSTPPSSPPATVFAQPAPGDAPPAQESQSSPPSKRRPNRWLIAAVVAVSLALVGVGIAYFASNPDDAGPATAYELLRPGGVAVDGDGSVYVADEGNHRVLVVGADGAIESVTAAQGQGVFGDEGPAIEAELDSPSGVAVGKDGTLYIADYQNHRVRAVGSDGIIRTVAGSGGAGFSGDDGPALEAAVDAPSRVAVAEDGTLYITDSSSHRVRAVGTDGIIRTVAGTGVKGFSGDDGPAVGAELDTPSGVAVGMDGTVYIADSGNDRVRAVGTDGTIRTVAGTGGEGFVYDGGPAIDAGIDAPADVAVGIDGTLYIAAEGNHRVLAVGIDGVIRTVAGSGTKGLAGDGGPAIEAELNGPAGVAVGSDDTVYITDLQNNRLRAVGPDGIIRTIVGS